MPSLKVASLYLFLDHIFPQPDEAAKAIRLFSFHLKSLRGQAAQLLSAWVPRASLVPSAQKSTLHFKGIMANLLSILLSLRARRNQVLQSSAEHNRHFAPLSLCCSKCIFLGVALLTKRTWSSPGARANTHSLWLPTGSGEAWPQLPLEREKTHGTAPGWLQQCLGSNPPTSCWVYCVSVQEGLCEIQRQRHLWMDYPSGTPESCVLSAAPPAPDSMPWSGHFILQRL